MDENHTNNDKFDSELDSQKQNFDAEKYSKQQEEYRKMMPNYDQNPDPYIWRIGFGRRFAAYLIDAIFTTFLMVIGFYATGLAQEIMGIVSLNDYNFMTLMTNEQFLDLVNRITPLSLAIGTVYALMEVFFAASPGKMLLGIIIGTADKKFAPIPKLFLRFCIKNISYFGTLLFVITNKEIFSSIGTFFSFMIFIGFFAILGAKRQGFHDMIAKTAVYFKDELKQFDSK